jgi:hypothetical protein
MKKHYFITIVIVLIVSNSYGQQQYQNFTKDKTKHEFNSVADIGLGVGINYGGLMGVQMQYVVAKHLGIFGSAGYYIVGFGWQVGAIGYLTPKVPSKPFRGYGTLMYGTNAAIYVEGTNNYNKIYYGLSIGGGFEMRFGSSKRNGINIDLFYPIRSNEFETDLTALKNNSSIEITEPLPITFSVGYHYEIR